MKPAKAPTVPTHERCAACLCPACYEAWFTPAPVVPVCTVAGCWLDPATHSHVGLEVAPEARGPIRAAMRREARGKGAK